MVHVDNSLANLQLYRSALVMVLKVEVYDELSDPDKPSYRKRTLEEAKLLMGLSASSTKLKARKV